MHAARENKNICSAVLRLGCLSSMLMPLKVARLPSANRLHHDQVAPRMAPHHLSQVRLPAPASALVHRGVRLCTHEGHRKRANSRLRQGLLTCAVDDVLADGGALCSGVCLLVGVAASSDCSCQQEKESADIIGIHTVSRGGKGTCDFVTSRSRSAVVVVLRALASAASKAFGSSFSASAIALSLANCASQSTSSPSSASACSESRASRSSRM